MNLITQKKLTQKNVVAFVDRTEYIQKLKLLIAKEVDPARKEAYQNELSLMLQMED